MSSADHCSYLQIDGLRRNSEGAIWIPDTAIHLQVHRCIIAHTGPSGRRGMQATTQLLSRTFKYSTLSPAITSFIRACIHFLSTIGGEKVPRPFGPSVHGTAASDLLQCDYVEIGPSGTG